MQQKPVTRAGLEREIERYLQEKKVTEPLFRFYLELSQIRERYGGQIKNNCFWSGERSREQFRQGHYLLEKDPLTIDPDLFRAILSEIVELFVGLFPQVAPLRKIMRQPELTGERLPQFLSGGKILNCRELERQARAWGWDDDGPVAPALVADTVIEALAPFYIFFAEVVREEIDHRLWSEGCCPVCGRWPVMALLNEEGVRILECRLCNTRWRFPRLECPFCRNRDPQRLRYFYVDDFPGRRVQVCERCKRYLKTVVAKEVGREVILDLEDIFTIELDHLARCEGYRAGDDLAVLQ